MQLVDDALVAPQAPATRPRALADGFDDAIGAIAADMANTGAACLENVVSAEWLEAARNFVTTSIPMGDKQELLIENFAAGRDNFAHHLMADSRVAPFLRSVATATYPRLRVEGQAIETELRLVNGPPRHDEPLWFHYDGTVATMVIPILIPTATPGRSGELVLHANRRPFRRSVLANIVEKCVSQNDVYRRRFIRKRKESDATTIALEPGNAYLFCGYRSYHATMPCPPDSLRVTLIMHFGAVHHDSRLLATVRSMRQAFRHRSLTDGSVAAVTLSAAG